MARITVEDCKNIVKNRFDLVVLAAQRVKQLNSGCPALYKIQKNEKSHIIALREIGSNLIAADDLTKNLINSFKVENFGSAYNAAQDNEDDNYNPETLNTEDFATEDDDDEDEEIEEDTDEYESDDEVIETEEIASTEGLSEYTQEELDTREKHIYDDEDDAR